MSLSRISTPLAEPQRPYLPERAYCDLPARAHCDLRTGNWDLLCLNAGPAAPVPHPLDRTVRQSSIGGCLANESNGPASRVQFHSHLEAVAAR